jgi:hypothetical protein
MALAQLIVWLLTVYVIIGLLYGLLFITLGVSRIDPSARGAGVGFRLLILPGVAALWPLLAWRWIRGMNEPPDEKNAHRILASTGVKGR